MGAVAAIATGLIGSCLAVEAAEFEHLDREILFVEFTRDVVSASTSVVRGLMIGEAKPPKRTKRVYFILAREHAGPVCFEMKSSDGTYEAKGDVDVAGLEAGNYWVDFKPQDGSEDIPDSFVSIRASLSQRCAFGEPALLIPSGWQPLADESEFRLLVNSNQRDGRVALRNADDKKFQIYPCEPLPSEEILRSFDQACSLPIDAVRRADQLFFEIRKYGEREYIEQVPFR